MEDFVYNLKNFIPYTGQPVSDDHKALAWNKKDGYYFTEFGYCVFDVKVIAVENK